MSRGNRRKSLDLTLSRIEAFNEANGGGVIIRKSGNGYSLFVEDRGAPLARLRPIGKGDMYNILWWSHREKWEPIGDFGGVHLPLEKALGRVDNIWAGCKIWARAITP